MQLSHWYPWLKALHVAFMVTWFAGLFYLPRLFIYHADSRDEVSLQRFQLMERRLYALMTIGVSLTLLFGILLLWINPGLLKMGWFQIKLALLVGLITYHVRCRAWMLRLRNQDWPDSTRWLRWFNEIPVIFLFGIICLAIAKPF